MERNSIQAYVVKKRPLQILIRSRTVNVLPLERVFELFAAKDLLRQDPSFSIKAVPFQNAILNVKELGGADNIRKYWSRYYQGSQGVIFVLDSVSSEGDLEVARMELHSALQHPQLCTLPFLILANHQDKPVARSIQEVSVVQNLPRSTGHKVK
ncbi:hypothetical protein Z043_118592 [Scleropages formosus]|uniref:ADP-ribosylation factor-like protein 15 n=1 Tax=Scleropages formosus TaxID=113540 RepID=A0A0P7UU63_SCLFO|nr:hypothetical protein Z043_118592 [Scleropages formosus]